MHAWFRVRRGSIRRQCGKPCFLMNSGSKTAGRLGRCGPSARDNIHDVRVDFVSGPKRPAGKQFFCQVRFGLHTLPWTGIDSRVGPAALTLALTGSYGIGMRTCLPSWPPGRVVIALAALYALALQALLGGMVSAGVPSASHIICLRDTGAAGQAPAKPAPVHGHMACCVVAHGMDAANPPMPISATIVWPVRHATAVIWRPEVVACPRAPPGVSASARAPPIV
ncbi:hypothetical protein ACQVP2_30365 [Methylobacterium aquaticum]|uniref:hypothetical protein n=1 Tax=Methylobacterium aquaticum TaxID=270351 RepID=UPI003D17E25F